MSDPYVGEIRMVGFNFQPNGWAFCNGQLMAIDQNTALFSLIGTTYGGDGQQTFALPNLQSRVPVHQGQGPGLSNRTIGEMSGTESVTLTVPQLAGHSHTANGSSDPGTATNPASGVWADTSQLPYRPFSDADPQVVLAGDTVRTAGGNQPHDNMLPFLAINFVIALFGVFPSQG